MTARCSCYLPAIAISRSIVVHQIELRQSCGGLLSYGPSLEAMVRRAAGFVDRILRGAKPAELPVEQPTEFELVINARTAQLLGLSIPQSVLLQATEIIQ